MNAHVKRLTCSVALSITALLLFLPASATMTVTYGSSTIHNHTDTNGTATVTLNPDPITNASDFFLETTPSTSFQNAMTNSLAANDWKSKLKFSYGGDLSGNLTVDVYNAKLSGTTSGGAQFLVHYNRGSGDPSASSLFWVQVVDSNVKNGGETAPYPDVYFSGYPAGGKLPFYFRPDETNLDPNPYVGAASIRNGSYTVNNQSYNYDLTFWDYPQRNANAFWRGELFLATYDSGTGNVKFYNGVHWGFDIAAVPELSSCALLAILILPVVFHLRRKGAQKRSLF